MYYYRARYYSTTLGRFLQTDPIGSKDDLNLYAYTGGDPVNGSDPTGMIESSAAGRTGMGGQLVIGGGEDDFHLGANGSGLFDDAQGPCHYTFTELGQISVNSLTAAPSSGSFASKDEAAEAMMQAYGKLSIKQNIEYDSEIIKHADGTYSANPARKGTSQKGDGIDTHLPGYAGYWHTHAAHTPGHLIIGSLVQKIFQAGVAIKILLIFRGSRLIW